MPLIRFAPLDTPSAVELTALADQLCPTFATASDREQTWPTPPPGARSVLLEDPGTLWGYAAGRWVIVAGPGTRVAGRSTSDAGTGGTWNRLHTLKVPGQFAPGRRYRIRVAAEAGSADARLELSVCACVPGTNTYAQMIALGGGHQYALYGLDQAVTASADVIAEGDWRALVPCEWRVWINSFTSVTYVWLLELEVADVGPAPGSGTRSASSSSSSSTPPETGP